MSVIGHALLRVRNVDDWCLSSPFRGMEFEHLILVMHGKRCGIRMYYVCHTLLGSCNSFRENLSGTDWGSEFDCLGFVMPI